MAAAVQAGRMTDSPGGKTWSAGLAVDDYAGEVRVDGVAGRGGRAGVGDLLTGVSRPLTVRLAKARMTFSVGGQGVAVRRSRMQSASAMHWSTMRWQVSVLSVSWMIARSACSAWTACSSIRWVSS